MNDHVRATGFDGKGIIFVVEHVPVKTESELHRASLIHGSNYCIQNDPPRVRIFGPGNS